MTSSSDDDGNGNGHGYGLSLGMTMGMGMRWWMTMMKPAHASAHKQIMQNAFAAKLEDGIVCAKRSTLNN